ncbi:MAG: hypothetical protein UX65_C0005G0015 [Parcubacteria group bacterium GW2011_GWB1_46_8]|nr:MAG: hypothetical protein UX14_C0028G0008 [Parcubacteria group bacterium GW2011_GWF1_45_5]KKU11287.1 MAG: hypothetical protein UX15_C0011G0011 [Parcubacteria group bacterium GW2011_GWA1_45_7]KKU46309.1 MAG: hypothetical protein UX65_C0005G0015 [Parcubacteria group bacterium GW2011_GWB1_46_8]
MITCELVPVLYHATESIPIGVLTGAMSYAKCFYHIKEVLTMRIVIYSITGLLDVISALGIITLKGVCASGACTFSTAQGLEIVVMGTPAALLALGTTIVINGIVLVCVTKGRAMIKILPH